MSDEELHLLECYGGPWDGRRIADQGSHFAVTSDVPVREQHELRWRRLGIYKRRRDGYHWWPNRD